MVRDHLGSGRAGKTRWGGKATLLLACAVMGASGAGKAPGARPDTLPAYGETRNERRIEVQGSAVVLATWEERAEDGSFVPHFGVSEDGVSYARVAPASYEIGLRYAPFDPLVNVPAVESALAAPPDARLFLVQFVTPPLDVFEERIAALGGIVRQYVPQFAWLVEIDPARIDDLAGLSFVRWAGPYHPAYRLHADLLAGDGPRACNLQVFTPEEKRVVAERVLALGGRVLRADAGKCLVEAVLTPAQLRTAASWDEVLFIDRWGSYEEDMVIVRAMSGADYLESVAGYTGEGVRGEALDLEFNLEHVDFGDRLLPHGSPSTGIHGAATTGILFGDGTACPRGLLPDAIGFAADIDEFGLSGPSRYAGAAELLDPPYQAVFQSSSVGSPYSTTYTTISADLDALVFDLDLLLCQSHGNAGTAQARPQSWAKNLISVGGIRHFGTLNPADDCWCGGASTGPAADGRVKPTLVHVYDGVETVGCCDSTSCASGLGGTSVSTPIVCGLAGLVFQMWGDGIFGNPVDPEGSVFENRPHASTVKALLVNTADQYDFSGAGHDLGRMHQGWGMPNVANLWDLRDRILVVDEGDPLGPFEVATYEVLVAEEEPFLKATLAYRDPPGNPAVQSQHRVNDLSLRVQSPSGTSYWGNAGLLEGPWSTPGGAADEKNTVENVFLQEPEPGTWTVEVHAVELVQDGHVETPEFDAAYSLAVSPVVTARTSIAAFAGEDGAGDGDVAMNSPGLRMTVIGTPPGSGAARISFDLARECEVRLRLFDVRGRVIATLYDGPLAAGAHDVTWSGRDGDGTPLGAGVYFARLEAGAKRATAKVVLAR